MAEREDEITRAAAAAEIKASYESGHIPMINSPAALAALGAEVNGVPITSEVLKQMPEDDMITVLTAIQHAHGVNFGNGIFQGSEDD